MTPPSQPEDGENNASPSPSLAQLVQIKYLLAGILAVAVMGRAGDWETNVNAVLTTFVAIYVLETAFFRLPGSISRLATISKRRTAAKAASERRLRRIQRDLERAEAAVAE